MNRIRSRTRYISIKSETELLIRLEFVQSATGFQSGIFVHPITGRCTFNWNFFQFPKEKILSQASETTKEQKYCLNLTFIYVIN